MWDICNLSTRRYPYQTFGCVVAFVLWVCLWLSPEGWRHLYENFHTINNDSCFGIMGFKTSWHCIVNYLSWWPDKQLLQLEILKLIHGIMIQDIEVLCKPNLSPMSFSNGLHLKQYKTRNSSSSGCSLRVGPYLSLQEEWSSLKSDLVQLANC